MENIDTELATLLAGTKPTPPAEYRAHILRTEIFPAVERWGFEPRFHREIPAREMHVRQSAALIDLRVRMTGKGAVVALIGTRGLGKTTIAAQFAIETAWKNFEEARKEKGPRLIQHCIYKKTAKLVARYKGIFGDFGTIETDALLESLDALCRQQEFLVIDELHECEDLKMRARVITDIVDRRYAACRDTVIIANQKREEFAATAGDSIMSRLSEHGCIIRCDWPSYRIQ